MGGELIPILQVLNWETTGFHLRMLAYPLALQDYGEPARIQIASF